MSHAFTEQGLLLAFKLQRELIQSEDRYEAAHSFVTCMDVCVSYPGKCKVQISSASLPTVLQIRLARVVVLVIFFPSESVKFHFSKRHQMSSKNSLLPMKARSNTKSGTFATSSLIHYESFLNLTCHKNTTHQNSILFTQCSAGSCLQIHTMKV